MPASLAAAAGTLAAGLPAPALGHAGERGHVLVLPTQLYVAGGTAAVAISFVALALVSAEASRRWAGWRLALGRAPDLGLAPSALSLVALALLVACGVLGSRDPLANPLPLTVWTLWWVGLTAAHALLGDLWAWLNPWRAGHRAIGWLLGRAPDAAPVLAYPERLGHWPAVASFLAFAWVELAHPAPQDPERLAGLVLAYAAFTWTGMALFGERAWLARAEAFSVFLRMVSWVAPVQVRRDSPRAGGAARRRLELVVPGAALLREGTLPIGAAAFVVLALATVTFDGLSRTFWWLGWLGVNPLEHPGRSELVATTTLGLVGAPLALGGACALAAAAGRRLAGDPPGRPLLGRLVLALVPIALGYHLAHYLPAFVIDAQHALRALSDPLARGDDLLGLAHRPVRASVVTAADAVRVLWRVQVGLIVGAHLVAVVIARALLGAPGEPRARSLAREAPFGALMIAYTTLGLWLLSTPVAA